MQVLSGKQLWYWLIPAKRSKSWGTANKNLSCNQIFWQASTVPLSNDIYHFFGYHLQSEGITWHFKLSIICLKVQEDVRWLSFFQVNTSLLKSDSQQLSSHGDGHRESFKCLNRIYALEYKRRSDYNADHTKLRIYQTKINTRFSENLITI